MSEFVFLFRASDPARQAAVGTPESAQRSIQAWLAWIRGDTDWTLIVSLYARLMTITPSPVVALNRAIALAQRDSAERGLEELRAIDDRDRLANYPFYPAAFGELELRRGNRGGARQCFQAALALARNPAERKFLEKRIRACD